MFWNTLKAIFNLEFQNWDVLIFQKSIDIFFDRFIFPFFMIILRNIQTDYSDQYNVVIIVLYI